ncbi:MAG: DNA/RNA non-specific endonuclease [Eubacterium sp.]|nr:DNA/RNA non-specific endonuclease [Eubacterium sp.]
MKRYINISVSLILIVFTLCACKLTLPKGEPLQTDSIPEYSGSAFVEVNGNIPDFKKEEITVKAYENYSEPDRLGRCRSCQACIGPELMPDDERGNISEIKPTGWHSYHYDYIDGGSLYNRCHLIAYMLTDEDANANNLITGTRYLNTEGMLPFEIKTADYINQTGNHVLYRATPIFKGSELVARGVQLEGYSVEDGGKGICFNVYCYNVQPNFEIDYQTGEAKELKKEKAKVTEKADTKYIINKSSGKFHRPGCDGVKNMSDKNRLETDKSRDKLITEGYVPCGECKP